MALNSLSLLALAVLTVQSASHSIVMRYSRGELHEKFITAGAVIMMEVVKGLMCIVYIYRQSLSVHDAVSRYRALLKNSWALSIPAGVYFLQNNLAYTALANMDAATFSVLSQLKLLSAAVFSVFVLHKDLSWRKWRGLFLLILGVILIIISADEQAGSRRPSPPAAMAVTVARDAQAPHRSSSSSSSSGNLYTGVLAVVGMAACSGFAGVYFEKVLKSSASLTIWDRNFQLSVYSIVFGTVQLLMFDSVALAQKGFFYDYSVWTWANILIGAVGGIIVAVVVKYTDTIMKGFATSAAIICTTLFGYCFFGTELSSSFLIGVGVVLISTFNYSEEEAPATAATSTSSGPPVASFVSSSSAAASSSSLSLGTAGAALPSFAPSPKSTNHHPMSIEVSRTTLNNRADAVLDVFSGDPKAQ